MGEVKIKTGKPQGTEFNRDDIVIDISKGDIYFKDRDGDLRFIENSPTTGVPVGVKVINGPVYVTGSFSVNNTGSFTHVVAVNSISGSNLGNTPVDGGSF